MTCFRFYCRRERKPWEVWNGSTVAGLAPYTIHLRAFLRANWSVLIHLVWWTLWFEHKLHDSANGVSLTCQQPSTQRQYPYNNFRFLYRHCVSLYFLLSVPSVSHTRQNCSSAEGSRIVCCWKLSTLNLSIQWSTVVFHFNFDIMELVLVRIDSHVDTPSARLDTALG
jgi:hypothetical protein